MVLTLAGGALAEAKSALVLDLLLFPLCVFGFVQYSLSTFGTVAFNSFTQVMAESPSLRKV